MALRSNISKIRASLKPAVGRGVHRGASMVADLAKQLAPVDTGALRASIQVEPPQPGPERVAVTAGRGLPDPRAVVNEYGSSVINFPPQPYMTPAYKAIDVTKEVKIELQALVKRGRIR